MRRNRLRHKTTAFPDRAVSVAREKRAVSTVLFRACAAIPKIILLKGKENAGAREKL